MPSHLNARNGLGRRRSVHRVTIAFISILCVVVVGHDLYRTWQDRSFRLDETRREVANLALSSDQHVADAFRLATIIKPGRYRRARRSRRPGSSST
jgi:hypothetical protein